MAPAFLVIGWIIALLVFATLAAFLLGLISYLVGIYNSLVTLKNNIDRSFSNIDVVLKQRHDELPKLIETCKGYMKFEQETLEKVIQARNSYGSATTPGEKAQADNMITGALRSLFAVAEKYPDLKADTNFMQLQNRITELEEKIADRREFFNDDVNTYNIRIQELPDVFIAKMIGLARRDLFKVTEADRQDVEVKLA